MGIEIPEGLTAQELRLWQDGFVAGRTFQLAEQLRKHPLGEASLPDGTPFPQPRPDRSPADEGQSSDPLKDSGSVPMAAPHLPDEAA
jgi:hypothetical protein